MKSSVIRTSLKKITHSRRCNCTCLHHRLPRRDKIVAAAHRARLESRGVELGEEGHCLQILRHSTQALPLVPRCTCSVFRFPPHRRHGRVANLFQVYSLKKMIKLVRNSIVPVNETIKIKIAPPLPSRCERGRRLRRGRRRSPDSQRRARAPLMCARGGSPPAREESDPAAAGSTRERAARLRAPYNLYIITIIFH